MLTEQQTQKFSNINDKVRKEEIRARNYIIKLKRYLIHHQELGLLDDFEIDFRFSIFSYDEKFCKEKNISVGDPYYEDNITYSLFIDDDESFEVNGFMYGWQNLDGLKDLHIGNLMHCLIDHSNLSIEDILAIDDVWIETLVTYQFWTNHEEI